MGMFDTINVHGKVRDLLEFAIGENLADGIQTKDMDLELVRYNLGDDLKLTVSDEATGGAWERWTGCEYHDKIKAGVFTSMVSSSMGALKEGYVTFVFINNKLVMISHMHQCYDTLSECKDVTFFVVCNDELLVLNNVQELHGNPYIRAIHNYLFQYEVEGHEHVIGVYNNLNWYVEQQLVKSSQVSSLLGRSEVVAVKRDDKEKLFNESDAQLIRDSLFAAGVYLEPGTMLYNREDLDNILGLLVGNLGRMICRSEGELFMGAVGINRHDILNAESIMPDYCMLDTPHTFDEMQEYTKGWADLPLAECVQNHCAFIQFMYGYRFSSLPETKRDINDIYYAIFKFNKESILNPIISKNKSGSWVVGA